MSRIQNSLPNRSKMPALRLEAQTAAIETSPLSPPGCSGSLEVIKIELPEGLYQVVRYYPNLKLCEYMIANQEEPTLAQHDSTITLGELWPLKWIKLRHNGEIEADNRRKNTKKTIEDLPREARRALSSAKIPEDLIGKNLAIILNILSFKNKGVRKASTAYQQQQQQTDLATSPPNELEDNRDVGTASGSGRDGDNQEILRDAESLVLSEDPRKLYKVLTPIGEGGYGKVFSATKGTEKTQVALKKMRHIDEKDKVRNFWEVHFLNKCVHPCIVKYNGTHIVGDELWLIMELITGGTLAYVIESQHKFPELQIAYIAKQVLNALRYMHSINIAHRDLKSANIMLQLTGEVKLIDFGLCAYIPQAGKKGMVGSPFWMPPEMILSEVHYCSADVWSLAICLVELANGQAPHRYNYVRAMFTAAIEGYPEPLEKPKAWTDKFKTFLPLCLQNDPVRRATPGVLLQHPFVQTTASAHQMAEVFTGLFMKENLNLF